MKEFPKINKRSELLFQLSEYCAKFFNESLRTFLVLPTAQFSVGSNRKIPNLEPPEPLKTEPRTYRTSAWILKLNQTLKDRTSNL